MAHLVSAGVLQVLLLRSSTTRTSPGRQDSKAAKEQNKAQHVPTVKGSKSRIYLEKNTYTPFLYYMCIFHAMSLLHSSCILHNTCCSKCPACLIFFITNTSWYDAYSMHVRPPRRSSNTESVNHIKFPNQEIAAESVCGAHTIVDENREHTPK